MSFARSKTKTKREEKKEILERREKGYVCKEIAQYLAALLMSYKVIGTHSAAAAIKKKSYKILV